MVKSVNNEREIILNSVKSFAIKKAKETAIKTVAKKLPFLFFGPVGPLTSLIIEKVVEIVINETEVRAFFVYTDLRVNEQGRAFIKNSLEYYNNRTLENEKKCIDSFESFASFVR